MKKICFLVFSFYLLLSGVSAQNNLPKYLYVAGQNGANVSVYNCNTKKTYTVPGYFHNIGVDNSGNVYILVCDDKSGWGNYYVYKNFNTNNPYQSFVWNQKDGIYSSMAMCVKGDDVVVAGVQSLGFNDKGYQSRMLGYVNTIMVFRTGYDRKSLKYDNFRGYQKVSGTKLVGYGEENNSGNPQGDHLSCVYHVDAVDYCNGYIYTCGWGEREYSKLVAGTKYYLVRRCPRVWKNGAEHVANLYVNKMDEPQADKTGAFWNIFVNGQVAETSGHLGSVPAAFQHSTPLEFPIDVYYDKITPGYPGFYREEFFELSQNKWLTYRGEPCNTYCRILMAKGADGFNHMHGLFERTGLIFGWFNDRAEDAMAVDGDCFYYVKKNPGGEVSVNWYKNVLKKGDNSNPTLEFSEKGKACTVQASFYNYTNIRIVAKK